MISKRVMIYGLFINRKSFYYYNVEDEPKHGKSFEIIGEQVILYNKYGRYVFNEYLINDKYVCIPPQEGVYEGEKKGLGMTFCYTYEIRIMSKEEKDKIDKDINEESY